MKRMLYRMLSLALCLCLLTAAAPAEEASSRTTAILPVDESGMRGSMTVAVVADAVYVLSASGVEAQLWRWQKGMTQAEAVAQGLLYAPRFNSTAQAADYVTSDPAQADAAHAISLIFSDGQTLYGFNGLENLVFTIGVTEEGLSYTDVAVLPYLDKASYILPIAATVAGDWLLWHDSDQNSRNYADRLLAFNLKTGAVKQAVLPELTAITSYKEGRVLVVCEADETQAQDGSAAVYIYDPRTDLTEYLGLLPKGVNVRRVAYSAALDMLIYQDKTRIMGWAAEAGAEQLGYIPTSMTASIYVQRDQLLYAADHTNMNHTALTKGYSTDHSLTMMGGTMYSVLSQFYNRFQDIPVYYTERKNGETWQEQLARTEDMPDMCLWTNPRQYAEAVQAGALMDLSVYPEIREYIEALYPAFRDLAVQNGGIYAVPVYAASYDGWFINKKVMNEMGLTEADVPTTLDGMITFAQKWNDEWAEKYPHFTLLNNTTNYRERLYYAIETEWKQLCQKAGKPVAYDNPVYLALLKQLDGADFTNLDEALKQTDPEVSEYKHALIWTGVKDVGNFDTYMEDYSDRIFLPMTLTADMPYVTSVQESRFWVVNARSENGEYCAALLAESIAKTAAKTAYTLRSDKTDPVENEAFAEELQYQLAYLASLEASVENSVNKEAALRRVAEQKEYIDNGMNGRRYLINPSAIEHYRSMIVPAAYVNVSPGNDPDMLMDMGDLEHQYLHWEITAQELVEALDALNK